MNDYSKVFCLFVVTLLQISNTWSRNCISSMFGYGVKDNETPFYLMSHEIQELNYETYGQYVGFYYSILYVPALLVVGHLNETCDRKKMVWYACIIQGLATFMNSFATELYQLNLLRIITGLS